MPAKLAKADITPVRQRTQFSCLAASMSMALKCHGQGHCDEDTVNKVMGAQPMRGASWEQALACAQHYGMRGTLTSPCTLKQLKAWTDAGVPVLIAWNPEGREWSHASLVFDVDDDENVHVADPNIPDPDQTVRVVPKAEFYAKWYEKWPNYLVRRPAMAIEREITQDGRQVMASDFMAGKKEQRSQKDKGMARFLKHGPVRPTEKSDAAKAMGKAQWDARKEEGRAGLPGAGLGAGYHKDKSRYERGEGKRVEREAGSLTQPLMTRRDYGVTASMKASDYASILKYAVNLPADVERYVEEVKEKNPDYSEGQAWATAWSIYCKYKNPGSDHCKQDASDYFPGRTAKFPAGVTMTVDEVADVVGPEFKEMNEDPPASVVKVREEMGKKARRSPMLAMDTFADMLKDSKFEKGKPADPTENMTEEDAAEWERQNEANKDKFKTAAYWDNLWVGWIESPEGYMIRFFPPSARGAVKRQVLGAVKSMGIDLEWTVMEASKAIKTRLDPYTISNKWFSRLPGEDRKELMAFFDTAPVPVVSKTAAVTAGGKYGFTKGTETACTAGVSKLQKAAKRIANALYAKDEGSVAFLQKHAARAGSKTASMLLTAMEDIGPAAMIRAGKTAGKSGNGLYGFSEKTAKLGLDACSALHHEAGVIAADLFARKGSDPVKVAGYLTANAKKGKCAFSAMLAEVAPDVAVEVTGTVKKKATDFLASDESADDEVADIISKC